jgi:hypothetical protein
MKARFTLSKLIPLVFVMGLFLMFEASAQQTKKISLQGFLKDANGKAVADGQQTIIFKLYKSATDVNADWTDTQSINVFGGVYSTHLGSTANPLDNLDWGKETYYVGVTVQGTELTPRTELTFAPYSLGSPKAQEVVCPGAVGDIKHSILNPTQFAAVNGNCWVPMDGRALATADKLRQITGMTTLPNGGGLFIRSQEFANSSNFDDNRDSNSPIASFQAESLKSHDHYASLSVSGSTTTNGNHNHGYYDRTFNFGVPNRHTAPATGGEGNTDDYRVTNAAGDHSHSISGSASGYTNPSSGSETRPDNLNFWVYIRIN